VSRQHLIINRNGNVSDLRSTNGTTINANVLPYGVGGELLDNDILVLANVEALQFRNKKPSLPLNVPEHAWAVLIDGQSRNYLYLTGAEYSLTFGNGKISLVPGLSESATLKLRRLHNEAQMFVATKEWQVLATGRSKESDYETYILRAATWVPALDLPLMFAKLSADQKQILAKGPAIQIVLFGE